MSRNKRYVIRQGDSLSRIAQQQGTTVSALMTANPQIKNPNVIHTGASLNIPVAPVRALAPIQGPTQRGAQPLQEPTAVQPQITPAPVAPFTPPLQEITPIPPTPIDLPVPTAPAIQQEFMAGMATEAAQARKLFETTIATQKADIDKRLADLKTEERGLLKRAEPLTEPFRARLEATERERLFVNENFSANQLLVGELEGLLTEGNSLVEQMRGVTGLAAIRNPRINQAIEAVDARVGVITAVMKARNGQITQAGNLIDRTVTAITADRNDQLNYLNTLLNLNNKRVITLEAGQRNLINQQTALIAGDLTRIQGRADHIKKLMLDPNTANLMALSGVTTNDTPQQILAKFADFYYQKEIRDDSNEQEKDGYAFLTEAEARLKPIGEINIQTDSRGVRRHWWKRAEETTVRRAGGARGVGEMVDLTPSQQRWAEVRGIDPFTPEGRGAILDHFYGIDETRLNDQQFTSIIGQLKNRTAIPSGEEGHISQEIIDNITETGEITVQKNKYILTPEQIERIRREVVPPTRREVVTPPRKGLLRRIWERMPGVGQGFWGRLPFVK